MRIRITELFHAQGNFFNLSDARLKFEQQQAMQNVKYLIEKDDAELTNSLDMAIDELKIYSEAIKFRQANYEQQAKLAQLNLFCSDN